MRKAAGRLSNKSLPRPCPRPPPHPTDQAKKSHSAKQRISRLVISKLPWKRPELRKATQQFIYYRLAGKMENEGVMARM